MKSDIKYFSTQTDADAKNEINTCPPEDLSLLNLPVDPKYIIDGSAKEFKEQQNREKKFEQ